MRNTYCNSADQSTAEERSPDITKPEEGGEYLRRKVRNKRIEGKNTLMERKTVIDLRKAVIELALPLTEPENIPLL